MMKAMNPDDHKMYYFVDKCIPFGASISCALFQSFSDALQFIIERRTRTNTVTNYLDDFLFLSLLRELCNRYVRLFIQLCDDINIPISVDKTEWANPLMVFLGILLDGTRKLLAIPEQKIAKATNIINNLVKATVKELQSLAGILNFFNRVIVPGRAFNRRIYAKFSIKDKTGRPLKHYHHVHLDSEFESDCRVWSYFLNNATTRRICRPFIDLGQSISATTLDFFTDISKSESKGFGCVFGPNYTWGKWPTDFIKSCDPSIEYLELYTLCVGILVWSEKMKNTRVIVFCDNQAVVQMVNNYSSSCKNCMVLIRKIVLDNLVKNRRLFVQYVRSSDNIRADSLSRMDFIRFFKHSPQSINFAPEKLPDELWPIHKIWLK